MTTIGDLYRLARKYGGDLCEDADGRDVLDVGTVPDTDAGLDALFAALAPGDALAIEADGTARLVFDAMPVDALPN